MEDTPYSRRKFLTYSVYAGSALLTGSWLFASCKPAQQATAASPAPASPQPAANPQPAASPQPAPAAQAATPAADPCDDQTGVAASEIDKRKKFAYVNVSPIADSKCGNCSLYMPPASGKACGGCMLFKGPVRATGYCTYWAPIS